MHRALTAGVVVLALAGCSAPAADGGVSGTVWYGPVCPVARDPPDPDCADRPYEVDLLLAKANAEAVVRRFSSEADGTFSVAAPAGEYTIRNDGQQPPSCWAGPFTLTAGAWIRVDVHCDSGIR